MLFLHTAFSFTLRVRRCVKPYLSVLTDNHMDTSQSDDPAWLGSTEQCIQSSATVRIDYISLAHFNYIYR